MTAAQLRAALDLSSADLCRRADAKRTDGKRTAPTTISRQLTGRTPHVDPWLALYVRTLADARDIDLGTTPEPAATAAETRRQRTMQALRASGLMPRPRLRDGR